MTTDTDATNPVEADDIISQEGVADEANAQGDDNNLDPTDALDGEADNQEDDAEEIEHEGQKYVLPKNLAKEFREGILRQADYTRKTQEIAETKRAIEAERSALAAAATAQEELFADKMRVKQLTDMVSYYESVDWDAADLEDPDLAAREWRKFTKAQMDLGAAKQELTNKEAARLREQQAATAQALQQTSAELRRTIPGWGQDLALKLMENATKNYGVSNEDLAEATDAPSWKMLHDLYLFQQAKSKQVTGARAQQAAQTAPIKTVGTKGGAVSPTSDRASIDAWMKSRNDSLRKGR